MRPAPIRSRAVPRAWNLATVPLNDIRRSTTFVAHVHRSPLFAGLLRTELKRANPQYADISELFRDVILVTEVRVLPDSITILVTEVRVLPDSTTTHPRYECS